MSPETLNPLSWVWSVHAIALAEASTEYDTEKAGLGWSCFMIMPKKLSDQEFLELDSTVIS